LVVCESCEKGVGDVNTKIQVIVTALEVRSGHFLNFGESVDAKDLNCRSTVGKFSRVLM